MNGKAVEPGNNGVSPKHSWHLWAMFFSLYLAFAIILATVLHGVFVPFVHVAQLINVRLGRSAASAAGGYTAFFAFTIVLTLLLIGPFGLLAPIARERQALRYSLLITTLLAAPICWFYVAHWYGWFPFEVIACSLCIVLLTIAVSRIPIVIYIVLCALHFGFWGLQFWRFTHNPAIILFPFAGFCASLAWIRCLSLEFAAEVIVPRLIT